MNLSTGNRDIVGEGVTQPTGGKRNWTPGPWKADGHYPWIVGDCTLAFQIWGTAVRVALTERQNVGAQQEEANANLIAAAPELYEALEWIGRWAANQTCVCPLGGDVPDVICGRCVTVAKARAALAKARGEELKR